MVRPQTIAKLTHLTSLAIWLLVASYLVIIYGLSEVFSHGITIVFSPYQHHRVCTNQALGWPEGSASEIFKGGTGRPIGGFPIIEVETTGWWFEIF